MWDATRGKPRAASFEGMKGQDKMEINKINTIEDEGQGDIQNNDGALGVYIPRSFLLYIYQAGADSTPFFLFTSWKTDSRNIGPKERSVEPCESPWMAPFQSFGSQTYKGILDPYW